MTRSTWCVRSVVHLAVMGPALFVCSLPAWAQKTDKVTLNNGDTITCEIKELQRGRLGCKTEAMGTVLIEWQHIRHIETDKTLEVELESGQRYFGAIGKDDQDDGMAIRSGASTTSIRSSEVAFVRQIKPTFWGRLTSSIDFGAQFTQSDDQFDYTLNADSSYTGFNDTFSVGLSSSIRTRNSETTNNRQSLDGSWIRQLRWDRWFGIALVSFDHNDELDLDLRSTAGYGVGRYLAQTNHWTLNAYATGLYSREKFLGEVTGDNNFEVGLGTDIEIFTFGDHDTDVSSTFVFLPSVTDVGRYRVRWNAQVKREFIRDLYFAVDMYESYDSRPPQQTAKKNDFGITMSFGWSH